MSEPTPNLIAWLRGKHEASTVLCLESFYSVLATIKQALVQVDFHFLIHSFPQSSASFK